MPTWKRIFLYQLSCTGASYVHAWISAVVADDRIAVMARTVSWTAGALAFGFTIAAAIAYADRR